MKTIAQIYDERADGLAKDLLHTEGQLLELLTEMRKKRLFAELNYSGVFDYCHRKFKFSRARSYYFKSVAEKADEVPELKIAVVTGEITLSQARRIVPAVNASNKIEWINKAKTLPQRELEREVAIVNPKARVQERLKPVGENLSELKVSANDETKEDLEVLSDVLSQKLKKHASHSEVVAWALKEAREKHDPIRRAKRAVSSGNKIVKPVRPGRHAVQASVKHPVTLRDEARCIYVSPDGRRCSQKRWLNRHHVIEVARGGLNTVPNVQTLCWAHHKFIHDKKPAQASTDKSPPTPRAR